MNLWLEHVICLLLQICGFTLFSIGFFPRKVALPGFNTLPKEASPFLSHNKPTFEKLIVVVIDAMRSDFMYSNTSLMHFLHSLVRDGSALPYTAYAHPPTVTLPRLKGITTGGTPSFIDAVFNIADNHDNSQGLSSVDSWVRQFKTSRQDRIIHFYGDDTWLKLFPNGEFFEKYEGTDSFFVSDFTDVDNNVTRHLNDEIKDQSWDALILHYLGLDHIGHKGGPNSIYMQAKQEEMDAVIEELYQARVANSEDTLMVVMGDHGMNNLGNHGGSTDGETSPGMVLASPVFKKINIGKPCPLEYDLNFKYFTSISQIDLVPTLATLFNFPIPINNQGVIIPEVLNLWPDDVAKKKILLENCRQFLSLLLNQFSIPQPERDQLQSAYKKLKNIENNSCEEYFSFLRNSQDLLASNSSNYLYKEIWQGYTLIIAGVMFSVLALHKAWINKSKSSLILFALLSVAYVTHFHGSSLIEEEHQIWWLLTVSLTVLLFFFGETTLLEFFVLLASLRIIRSWCNTGQKFSTEFTIAEFLKKHSSINWMLIITTYIVVMWFNRGASAREKSKWSLAMYMNCLNFLIELLSVILILYSVYFKTIQYRVDGKALPKWLEAPTCQVDRSICTEKAFDKTAYQNISIKLSQNFYWYLSSMSVIRIIGRKLVSCSSLNDITNATMLFLLHQTRPEIIPIFLVLVVLNRSIKFDTSSDLALEMLLNLCLQNLTFFSMGNSNLLATVDLSNAYNGISEYNILSVSFLAFASNFSGVIFWLMSQINNLAHISPQLKWRIFYDLCCLKVTFYTMAMSSLVSSCINLRYHLFIWSVFSPKLLFFAAWVLWVNVLVDSLYGGVILASV